MNTYRVVIDFVEPWMGWSRAEVIVLTSREEVLPAVERWLHENHPEAEKCEMEIK